MDKLFGCDDSRFFEALHSPSDFEVDVSVGFDGELVFVHDFINYECAVDAEVLLVLYWVADVEVFGVNTHVAGSLVYIGYDAVNVNFCSKDGDCWGAWVSGIVKVVIAGGHEDTEVFFKNGCFRQSWHKLLSSLWVCRLCRWRRWCQFLLCVHLQVRFYP